MPRTRCYGAPDTLIANSGDAMTGEKTLVLVGAGPRMGLSIATVFGAKGSGSR